MGRNSAQWWALWAQRGSAPAPKAGDTPAPRALIVAAPFPCSTNLDLNKVVVNKQQQAANLASWPPECAKFAVLLALVVFCAAFPRPRHGSLLLSTPATPALPQHFLIHSAGCHSSGSTALPLARPLPPNCLPYGAASRQCCRAVTPRRRDPIGNELPSNSVDRVLVQGPGRSPPRGVEGEWRGREPGSQGTPGALGADKQVRPSSCLG